MYEPQGNQHDEQFVRSQRAEVSLTCEVRQGTGPWMKLKLHDISASGFRMDWRPGLTERALLYIRIPGMQMLSAHLRWKREDMIGCEFTSTLYGPVYDHIVAQSLLEHGH